MRLRSIGGICKASVAPPFVQAQFSRRCPGWECGRCAMQLCAPAFLFWHCSRSVFWLQPPIRLDAQQPRLPGAEETSCVLAVEYVIQRDLTPLGSKG